jgi:hypothetical protein
MSGEGAVADGALRPILPDTAPSWPATEVLTPSEVAELRRRGQEASALMEAILDAHPAPRV